MSLRFGIFVTAIMGIAFICDHALDDVKNPELPFEIPKVDMLDTITGYDGFIEIPKSVSIDRESVVVVVPKVCPEQGRQRAESLEKALEVAGVPFEEIEILNFEFVGIEDPFQVRKLQVAMNGDIPTVMVKGAIKANPTADEVITRYKKVLANK
jgi:hypothetical protein